MYKKGVARTHRCKKNFAINYATWGPRLARTVLRDSLRVKKGEFVTFEVWTNSLPWVDSFVIETRRIGAHPLVIYESDRAYWSSLDSGDAKQLGTIGAHEIALLEKSDAYVLFWGPSDRVRFFSLPDQTRKVITAYEDNWFKTARDKGVRCCRLELSRASEKLAAHYNVDYKKWVTELYEASNIDPSSMNHIGSKIAEILRKGTDVLITHPNGTRLQLRLSGREPLVEDSVYRADNSRHAKLHPASVPSGAVYVAIDENFAEGTIKANRISRFGTGRGVAESGRWTFHGGRLVKYTYRSGAEEFERDYSKAGAEKTRPGFIMIGLNPKIHDSPLFEEYEKGTICVTVGSNNEIGGAVKGHFHGWLLLGGADLSVDGRPILKAGKII